MELRGYSAVELIKMVRKRELKVYDMVEYFLGLIKRENEKINAFISVNPNALKEAAAMDSRIERGEELGELCGIPIGVKDNIAVKGMKNTCGSKMLMNYISPYDGEVVELIKKEDGIIIGKTNMDEFGMGCAGDNSCFGRTSNPLNTDFSPGGSSGGSAAAVAAGMVPLSLGSDTGGSVRQPASFCGVYGFKPTYGGVSRYGLTTFASTLDTVGIIGKCSEDAELLLHVISSKGERDSTFRGISAEDEIGKIRIGAVCETLMDDVLKDKEVREKITLCIDAIEEAVGEVKSISVESLQEMLWSYYIISSAEAATTLSRYDGITFGSRSNLPCDDFKELIKNSRSEGFGIEVKKRIMAGNYIISHGHKEDIYGRACAIRENLKKNMMGLLEEVDVMIMPTAPGCAFNMMNEEVDMIHQYSGDIFTVPASLGGFPAVSIKCGEVGGMPLGLQLIGGRGKDFELIKISSEIEKIIRRCSHV